MQIRGRSLAATWSFCLTPALSFSFFQTLGAAENEPAEPSILPESPTLGFSILAYGQTGLAHLNPPDNGGAAEVTETLFDGAGQRMGESTITLSAGSRAVDFLNQASFFDSNLVAADFYGSVEISSTQPVVPVAIRIEGSRPSSLPDRDR